MSTDEDLQRVAEQMRPHVPELVERIQRRLRAEVPQFFASADPGLAAVEAPAIADSLNDILDGLAGGSKLRSKCRPEPCARRSWQRRPGSTCTT